MWDRMEDWNCQAMPVDDNEHGKIIASSVEYYDNIPVPDWCPKRIENQK
jgi:hypothetical protein